MSRRLAGWVVVVLGTAAGHAIAQPRPPEAPPPTPATGSAAPAPPPATPPATTATAAPPEGPPPQAPGAYPGYPPVGPAPGYAYPGYPPAGYAPQYGYAQPPQPPARSSRPRYASDAAAQNSPFFDVIIAGFDFDHRYGYFLNPGLQVGGFLGGRVRVAVRGLMVNDDLNDQGDLYSGTDDYTTSSYYNVRPVQSPWLVYGASVGVAVASSTTFVASPGLVIMRSNENDYGSSVGLALPFDWSTPSGMRIGFEVDLGRSFGGTVHGVCTSGTYCTSGNSIEKSREGGSMIYFAFTVGLGLNPPKPLPEGAPQ